MITPVRDAFVPVPAHPTVRCNDCLRELPAETLFTEINPPGGYGRPQFLACDECMRSGRWDHWKVAKWPNWPEFPRTRGTMDC